MAVGQTKVLSTEMVVGTPTLAPEVSFLTMKITLL